jgi:outer membrane protein assembly factor BamB
VTQLEHFDRLLVFTDAGKLYVRKAGTWQAPVNTTSKFPALSGLALGSVYHLASPPSSPALVEGLTFVANPTAVLYDYNADDSVVYVTKVTMKDDPAPAAPHGTGTILWDFEVRDAASHGTANYFLGYYGYSNGMVYQLDAAAVWKSWPAASAPFFAGKTNAPTSTKMRAAWFDAKLNRAYFIGPA